MVVHSVRRIPKVTWTNDRDQFYQPLQNDLPREFVSDCVIWSAFAPSNNTASLKDIPYQGKIYQIHNEMFPFTLSEVKTWKCSLPDIRAQLFAANEDRFMAKWIAKEMLSAEAIDVLNAANKLYRCVYEKLNTIQWLDYKIQLWDIGWWQVKEAAKQIEAAAPSYEQLRLAEKKLEDKLVSQFSELGFMAPDIHLLEE